MLPADRTANLLIWAAIWSALWGWQAVTVAVDRLPSFVLVVRALRATWLTRWALLAGWVWLGWHIFVRTTY
jgi:hypothetical protein